MIVGKTLNGEAIPPAFIKSFKLNMSIEACLNSNTSAKSSINTIANTLNTDVPHKTTID